MLFIITTTTKISAQQARGRARLFFSFSFILFISFILLIQFNYSIQLRTLRFLKTPASAAHTTTARVHFQVRSGPVSRSNGAAQRAIVRSIRTRTTSRDLDGRSKRPKHARAKSAKRSKNQTNPEKRKKSLLDPGRHFPVPYYELRSGCSAEPGGPSLFD